MIVALLYNEQKKKAIPTKDILAGICVLFEDYLPEEYTVALANLTAFF